MFVYLTSYAEVILHLLSRLPVSYLANLNDQQQQDEALETSDTDLDISEDDDEEMKEIDVDKVSPSIRERLKHLYNSDHINHLKFKYV